MRAGDAVPGGGSPGRGSASDRLARGLEWSRYLVALPVVVLLVSALGAFVYGGAVFVDGARRIGEHPFPVGKNIGLFVLVIDLFLVGATLLIAAIGLYELFIGQAEPDPARTRLRRWLVMDDLNDLKARVVSMIVLVSAVSFVEVVVDFRDSIDVLYVGAAIALVIGALTAFLRLGQVERGPTDGP